MASTVTSEGAYQLRNGGSVLWLTSTIKARLCVAGTVDVGALTMEGHTGADGTVDITITSPTLVKDGTNNRLVYGCADFLWLNVAHTGNATHIGVYLDGASDGSRLPICFVDLVDQSLTGATRVTYAVPTTGLFYLRSAT